jgi:tetratricopeptide (TPR) repeat protein
MSDRWGFFLPILLFILTFSSTTDLLSKPSLTKGVTREAEQYYMMAKTYHDMGKRNQAFHLYEKAISIDVSLIKAYTGLTRWYAEENRYRDAIAVITRLIQQYPKNIDFYYSRAYFYTLINNYDAAFADWTTMIALEPNSVAALWSRGHYLRKHNRYQEALADFEQLHRVDTDPTKISTYFLALTQIELNQYQEAIQNLQIYETASLKGEENQWHTLGEIYFLLARSLRLSGQKQEAALYYSKAIEHRFWPDATKKVVSEAQRYSNNHLRIRN